MLSLFGILNMAGQSLSVEQEATAVTGQNLANVNNPAYADQTLQVETAPPLQTSIGEEGTGVEAVSINQLWDSILNSQIVAEGSVGGSLTAQQSALKQAEAYLNEQISSSTSNAAGGTSSADGLTADLSSFFNSLQSLSTDPSSIPDRQAVVQSGEQLAQQFNTVASGLNTVGSDLNESVQSDVASANQDLTQIASLNQQIIEAQASGGTANDLIDEREQTLENLAGYVNLTTSAGTNGAVDVSIGGVTMVSGVTTPDSLSTYTDAAGNLMVQAQTAGTPLTITGGSIGGEITARDGALADLQSSINTVASQLITQFNNIYSTGYDLNGNNSQSAFFTGSNAGGIGVNATVLNDPSTFQAAATAGAPGDNTVVLQLANLATQALSGLGNQTISQNYAAAVGSFGSSLESVNDQLTNSTSVSQMLATQRSSETGVNTDTEMTNLMQYQKAYEASAELITTVNEMLETLVTMKTE